VDPCAGAGVGLDDGEISSQSGMGIQFFLDVSPSKQLNGQAATPPMPGRGPGRWSDAPDVGPHLH
jgi:hypothetical protein